MTNEPSPRPWRADEYDATLVRDADGRFVARADAADAALIVDAVNFYDRTVDKQLVALLDERDRLRDIVRRMMEKLAVLNAGYRLMLSEGPEDAEMADLCSRIDALVREARAALGEGETPTGKGVGV